MIRLTLISTPPSKYLNVTARSNINSKKSSKNNSHVRFSSGGYHQFPFLRIAASEHRPFWLFPVEDGSPGRPAGKSASQLKAQIPYYTIIQG